MLPTPHLRLVKRNDNELGFGKGTLSSGESLILQQWWHKPGWTKVGDPDMGEWRDVPLVELEKALDGIDDRALIQERYDAEAGKNTQRLLDAMDDKAGETKMTVEDPEGKRRS